MPEHRYVRWFEELSLADVPQVGGKNASLGELLRALAPLGRARAGRFRDHRRGVPRATSPRARGGGDLRRPGRARRAGRRGPGAASAPRSASGSGRCRLPTEVRDRARSPPTSSSPAPVRSRDRTSRSAPARTAEDLPPRRSPASRRPTSTSAAPDALLDAVPRLLWPRCSPIGRSSTALEQGFDHLEWRFRSACRRWCAPISPAPACIFTIDTESGFRDVVLINGAWGLGENVVQGGVDPDEF